LLADVPMDWAGLDLVKKTDPGMIMSDERMPGINWLELYNQNRSDQSLIFLISVFIFSVLWV
jgi:YesN/AraC family two-component response regulator